MVRLFARGRLTAAAPSPYMPVGALALSVIECYHSVPASSFVSVGVYPGPNFWRETYMKFRPLHDRVVVRRLEGEEKTKGGIIIPDNAKEKPQEGEIIAVGPGGRDEAGKLTPMDVKRGDKVLFGKWSGTEVKIDGKELLIMKESDIMGVIAG